MEVDVYDLLASNAMLLTFTVIGIGYLLGQFRLGGVQVGSTTGVLLAGLLLGHLGMPDRPEAATFGFSIFIFSVGLQAGPSFFSAFRADGPKYVALAAVVAVTAVTLALVLSRLAGLEQGFDAGLLAGALTSTPTLAGAEDAVRSGLARLPEGMTAQQASDNVSVGYALTYVFGTVGLILLIRYAPIVLRVDLPAEAASLARDRGMTPRRRGSDGSRLPIIRAYHVAEAGFGQTIEQRRIEFGKHGLPLRVRRGHELLEPEPSLELRQGDVISLIASLEYHEEIQGVLGQEVLDPELLDFKIDTLEIVVINPQMAGQPLGALGLVEDYGCYPLGLVRASIDVPVDLGSVLQKGDRLLVAGEESRLHQLADRLGHVEEEVEQTDLLTFCFGIAAGVLLGLVVFKIGGLSIGLGSAGGLLVTGIGIGFLSSINPTFGRVPGAARTLLMDLGLMLFMAEVGLKAGGGIGAALTSSLGPVMIGCGIVVTLGPVLVGYGFGRYALKLNPAILLGSITGAMTSTPSLQIVTEEARSPVPALGYAGTYTFANVMLTFAGTLIMML